MILPIKLTDQLGLPGGGVPAFAMDPSTGDIIGASSFPAAASGIDPATGEPVSTDSAVAFTNSPMLYPVGSVSPQNITNPGILNINNMQDTRGTQWSRQGSYLSESDFDKWRRAGRPTRCSLRGIRRLRGMGMGAVCSDGTQPMMNGACDDGSTPSSTSTWSGSVAAAIAAGVVDASAALLPAGSVVQSGPNGITVATPGNVSTPGITTPYVAGGGTQLAVTASASPFAWLLGLGLVGYLLYTVNQR